MMSKFIQEHENVLFSDAKIPFSALAHSAFGLFSSLFLQQIHFITRNNDIHGLSHWKKQGHQWYPATYEALKANILPSISTTTIKREVGNLIKLGVIDSKYLDSNTWKRQKWYRIEYEKLAYVLEFYAINGNLNGCALGHFDPMSSGHFDPIEQVNLTLSTNIKIYKDKVKIETEKQQGLIDNLEDNSYTETKETDMTKSEKEKELKLKIKQLQMQLTSLEDYDDDDEVPEPNVLVTKKNKVTGKTVQSVVSSIKPLDKTPKTSIIAKYKLQPFTAANFSRYWRELMVMFHSSAGPVVAMSTKDMGQLKYIFEHVDKFHERLYKAMSEWDSYSQHCKEMYGAFPITKVPTIGFVQKNIQGLVSYSMQSISKPTEKKTTSPVVQAPKWSKQK